MLNKEHYITLYMDFEGKSESYRLHNGRIYNNAYTCISDQSLKTRYDRGSNPDHGNHIHVYVML